MNEIVHATENGGEREGREKRESGWIYTKRRRGREEEGIFGLCMHGEWEGGGVSSLLFGPLPVRFRMFSSQVE